MAVYIAPISWGLGDAVVSLPVLNYFIEEGQLTRLIVRHELQEGLAERIEGLDGWLSEQSFSKQTLEKDDLFFNLREHDLQRNHWWGTEEFANLYPRLTINEILSTICQDFGFSPDFNYLEKLTHQVLDSLSNSVALIAGSDGPYKLWPAQHWMQLNTLLQKRGFKTVLLGQPQSCPAVAELIDLGLGWRPTPDLGAAIDVLSSCAGVVGVDTGLSHIAVQQGVRTVTLFRQHSVYSRSYAHSRPLFGGACADQCLERFIRSANNTFTTFDTISRGSWACQAPAHGNCMAELQPEAVFETLISLVSAKRAG